MTQEKADTADVTLDLLAIQSNAQEAIRDYSRYLRNAEWRGVSGCASCGGGKDPFSSVTAVVDRDLGCIAAGHAVAVRAAPSWPDTLVTDRRDMGKSARLP